MPTAELSFMRGLTRVPQAPLRDVSLSELTRGTDPGIHRDHGWLAWRDADLCGLRVGGPFSERRASHLEAQACALAASRAAPMDLLIDANGLVVRADDLERVADLAVRLTRRFGPWLRRIALVAPLDWSTPWWHGLPLLAPQPETTWRIFARWTHAYAWLDASMPRQAELERAIAADYAGLVGAFERAVTHAPASDLAQVAHHLGLSEEVLRRALVRRG